MFRIQVVWLVAEEDLNRRGFDWLLCHISSRQMHSHLLGCLFLLLGAILLPNKKLLAVFVGGSEVHMRLRDIDDCNELEALSFKLEAKGR